MSARRGWSSRPATFHRHCHSQRLEGVCRVALYRVQTVHAEQPRMAAIVGARLKHPILVVAAQAHHVGARFLSHRENRIHARLAVGAAIDVVAEEDERVPGRQLRSQLLKQIGERLEMTMDVADDERWQCLSRSARSFGANGFDGQQSAFAVGER